MIQKNVNKKTVHRANNYIKILTQKESSNFTKNFYLAFSSSMLYLKKTNSRDRIDLLIY